MISPFFNLKPMALEQVMSDRDSEDEVDDDIADFEDRRVCLLIMSLFFCFVFYILILFTTVEVAFPSFSSSF
jgi:hypothetical protein